MKNFTINLIIIIVLAGLSIPLAITVLQGNQEVAYKIRTSAQNQTPMAFKFTSLRLHGIGSSGDHINGDSGKSNKDPNRRNRTVRVNIYNTSNGLLRSILGDVRYDDSTGVFKENIEIGTPLAAGNYIVKVKIDGYLRKSLGTIKITANQDPTMPSVQLVAGDLNGDNVLNIADFNIFSGCYQDILEQPTFCDRQREGLSDLSDDGAVNQKDYNLFLRELDVQHGD